MILRCIGSGSSGNCYALIDENEILLLDLGIPYKTILENIQYRISDVVGACVTHSHKDHSLSVLDAERYGVNVFAPYDSEMERQVRTYGNFVIKSFKVPHDGTPCCGFLIQHPKMGKLLYMTDLEYPPYSFKKVMVNHILCEANYDMRFVDESNPNYKHVLQGHMGLQTCINKVINENKSCYLRNVILCHLSKENADVDYFTEYVKKTCDCPVYVAEKGIEVSLDLSLF